MGAKLGRNERGWEASVVAIDLTKKGQEVFGQNSLVNNYIWEGFWGEIG